jgi:hypothetical protein
MQGRKKIMRIEESTASTAPEISGIVAKVRKIVKYGNSYYVALPQEFIKKYHFKPGDKVGMLSDVIVKVIPMKEV